MEMFGGAIIKMDNLIISREYLELVLANVEGAVRRHTNPEEEFNRRFGNILDRVHSFLTERGDSIDRLAVVRAVERLEKEGVISPYPVEDRYRIAEAYIQRYCKKEGPSPEALIAMDS